MNILSSILLLLLPSFYVKSQNIDDLIQANKNNLNNLYQKREAPPTWVESGHINHEDINRVLNEYHSNVGLLIYHHHQDTLSTILIDKQGKVDTRHHIIEEEVLIKEIDNANKFFSREYLSRAPTKRGAKPPSLHGNKASYQNSYEHINHILLPFNAGILNTFDHLIIVPTLNISIIPFSALKISTGEYLIELMSYSIAPSLYELMVNNQMNGNRISQDEDLDVYYNFQNALFIANPAFPKNSSWNFPSLPGTEKEVNYITNKLDRSTYTKLVGADAAIQNFKDQICDYDLLYFATHGLTDENNSLDNSFLVFAERKDQSYLTARDIQSIRHRCSLHADLVILSACQTGLGKPHPAGLIGLSRAFQIAGANHIVMSLWNISDEETAILMGLFFDNLMKGGALMPHAALRKAILTYKNNFHNHPNYWAAFSIFGVPY